MSDLLYEKIYQETQGCGRAQFVKLLQQNQIKIEQLQQENKKIKNILTEFENWLEEEVKQYQPYISENMIFKPNIEYEIVKSIYDKLQELKGDNE